MRSRHLVCLITVVILLGGPAVAQAGAPFLYVSTGETILKVDIGGGTEQVIHTDAAADFQGLVYGGDDRLYACDPDRNLVLRMDADGSNAETVYQGTGADPLQQPQCGRMTATGDLYLTSQAGGTDVWSVAGARGIPFGGALPAPAAVALGTGLEGAGITQANSGDFLIVDSLNERVLNLPLSSIGPATPLITSGVGGPQGIARASNGDLYVATTDGVARFDSNGAPLSDCDFGLKKQDQPYGVTFAADNTLYVTTTSNKGKVWEVDVSGSCSLIQSVQLAKPKGEAFPPAQGVAIPSTSRTLTKPTFTGTQLFNFDAHAYELTASDCTAAVSSTQTPVADLETLIGLTGESGVPVPYLGEAGWGTVYDVTATPAGCLPAPDGFFGYSIAAFTASIANARMIRCDSVLPLCEVVDTEAFYPFNPVVLGDAVILGKGNSFSLFFLADVELTTQVEFDGQFCGFNPPLTQSPPEAPAIFDSGSSAPFKFRLAQADGDCQQGPFITVAEALLSVVRIADENGNPVFEPQVVVSTSSANEGALFRNDQPSKQYEYNLDLAGYPLGTFSASVLFLSNNEAVQTTEFVVTN